MGFSSGISSRVAICPLKFQLECRFLWKEENLRTLKAWTEPTSNSYSHMKLSPVGQEPRSH